MHLPGTTLKTAVTGDGLNHQDETPCIFKDLSKANALTIDSESIREFNIYDEEGDDSEIYLDASQFQFTRADLNNATKENFIWTITDEDTLEKYCLTCERVMAF
jgi:hypothetical protein